MKNLKKGPPHDDPDAVRRIQKALVAFGYKMPLSFPQGPGSTPDGIFGSETFNMVMAFQKREFSSYSEWDGRVGKNTLTRMDLLLGATRIPEGPSFLPPIRMSSSSSCTVRGTKADASPPASPRVPASPSRR